MPGAQQVQRVTPGLLRYAPGWAIGAWFVPFLNLVRPVQIVNDVRRLGAPDRLRDSRALVGWWWATLLGSRLAIWVFVGSGSPDNDGVDLDALRSVAVGAIICMVIDLVAAVLAVAVVLSTTRRVQSGSDAAGWSPWQAYGYPPPAYPPPGYAQPAYPPPASRRPRLQRRRTAGRRRAQDRAPSHPSDPVRRWPTGLVCGFPDHQLGGGVP